MRRRRWAGGWPFAFPVSCAGKKWAAHLRRFREVGVDAAGGYEGWACPRPRFSGGARSKAALRAASCTSAAEALFPFSRADSARVNSCPSRAWLASGFVLLLRLFTACLSGLSRPSFSGAFYGTSQLVPFPGVMDLRVRASAWPFTAYLSGLSRVPLSCGLVRHE